MKSALGVVCIAIMGASLALAQAPVDQSGVVWHANVAQPVTSALVSPVKVDDLPAISARAEGGPLYEVPLSITPDKARVPGSNCPTGYICGQNADRGEGNAWYYSDLDPALCSASNAPTCPSHCIRRTAENFPPPGVAPLPIPVGVITLVGAFNGPDKPQVFEIKFYPLDPADPNRLLYYVPICSYPSLAPHQVTKIGTINWTGGGTGNEYQYTFVLPTPCSIAQGYFSVAISSVQAGSNWLWQPSDSTQGDQKTTSWWTSPNLCVSPISESDQDRQYCFGENKPGACCNDATALCDPNSNEFACAAVKGRFRVLPANCGALDPPCGSALGACCHDDGTCTSVTYADCVGSGACCVGATCTIYSQAACVARNGIYKGNDTSCSLTCCAGCFCRGDTNCDSMINFADINPFVQGLGGLSSWQTAHPACPWQNLDINNDGVVSFADINPFVARLAIPGPCLALLTGPDKTQGNQWLGPDTLCTSCCTIVVDPLAPKENEPNDCATDNFNGGCNSSPTTFTSLPLNTWLYGESGTFGPGYRDTDWYLITLASGSNYALKIEFEAEFDIQVELARPGDCDANWPTGYAILNRATATKCADPNTTFIMSRCLPAGYYWIVVSPQAFTGVPCGADYKIRVTHTTGCSFCSVPPPSAGNVYHELEPCGGNTNGGCNVTPNAFEFVGTDWAGTIRGSLYAKYPQRDLDWYTFKISAPARIKWDVTSELPVRASIEYRQLTSSNGYLERIPPICGGTNYYCTATLFSACMPGSSGDELYYPDPNDPNLPFFLFIAPEDAAGPIFDGYPCETFGTHESDYNIALTTTGLNCPTICQNFGWIPGSDPAEGEPVCSNNYADNYNFGCDKAAGDPNRMLVLNDGVALCAQGGIFTKNSALRPDYDWYKFTITGSNAQLHIETAGEFAYNVELYYSATNSCNSFAFQEKHTTTPCEVMNVTSFCYAPGTYWFRVYALGTSAPCGENYVLRVTAINQGCVPCGFEVPPASPPGCVSESETCGQDANGGCNSTAGLFGTIACNECVYGSTWANGGSNDTDYYKLILSTAQYIQWTADAEFPAVIWLFESPLSCTALSGDAEMAGACYQVTHKILDANNQQILLPAGTYYILVQPGTITDHVVTSITENYACGANRNDYWLRVECSDSPFP